MSYMCNHTGRSWSGSQGIPENFVGPLAVAVLDLFAFCAVKRFYKLLFVPNSSIMSSQFPILIRLNVHNIWLAVSNIGGNVGL